MNASNLLCSVSEKLMQQLISACGLYTVNDHEDKIVYVCQPTIKGRSTYTVYTRVNVCYKVNIFSQFAVTLHTTLTILRPFSYPPLLRKSHPLH